MTPINQRLGSVGEINRRAKRSYSNAVFCVSYVKRGRWESVHPSWNFKHTPRIRNSNLEMRIAPAMNNYMWIYQSIDHVDVHKQIGYSPTIPVLENVGCRERREENQQQTQRTSDITSVALLAKWKRDGQFSIRTCKDAIKIQIHLRSSLSFYVQYGINLILKITYNTHFAETLLMARLG